MKIPLDIPQFNLQALVNEKNDTVDVCETPHYLFNERMAMTSHQRSVTL